MYLEERLVTSFLSLSILSLLALLYGITQPRRLQLLLVPCRCLHHRLSFSAAKSIFSTGSAANRFVLGMDIPHYFLSDDDPLINKINFAYPGSWILNSLLENLQLRVSLIPWSDIMALKANYPEDAPGTLEVVLSRRPLFFREINPQPRKHTLWQATSDFTGGQASIHRRHFMQCPQGLLGKHFEKLIQCDPRLNFLSQQSDLVLGSPYFELGTDQIESSGGFDKRNEERASLFGLHDLESGSAVQSTSSKSEHNHGKTVENVSQEITSPSSVMNTNAMKDFRSRGPETLKFLSNLDQIKLPGLHPSMSMNDLVSHIGNCISEQCDSQYNRSILEEFTQSLFNDTQLTTEASDEQYIMSRVNSLYCLLQKDPSAAQDTTMIRNGNGFDVNEGGKFGMSHNISTTHVSSSSLSCKSEEVEFEGENDDGSGCKQEGSGISRKESFGELLINLPRIASMPQFLFQMAEDSGNHVR
ncbi:PREDICTED: uncharacterized protein LOC109326667 [Lupinus angustifolius]|uniref:uncharacterized protein LOC109326667 n=1 Tax=Lupinus angustifolius TaxID=3871 RepID=UPI00092E782E|nr:PREDICTED: uncharacterized protein LOC109326667 [Lupinus angustifolius]